MFCVACICIAYMICAYDVAVNVALALPHSARIKKIQRNIRTCVFQRGLLFFFEYGLFTFCVQCMILANDVARQIAAAVLFMCMICAHGVDVKIAIALLLMSKTRKRKKKSVACCFLRRQDRRQARVPSLLSACDFQQRP